MNCDRVPLFELAQGTLTEAEAAQVALHLQDCATCRERLRLITLLDTHPSLLRSRQPKRWSLPAAAALMILIMGGLYVFLSRPASPADLATQVPYPYLPLTTRDSSQQNDDQLAEAMERYSEGDFTGARELLSALPARGDVQFYLGVSEYLAGRPDRAIVHLETAARLDSKWKEASLWYEANSALQLGDAVEATRILKELKQRNREFSQQAGVLLEQLEEKP